MSHTSKSWIFGIFKHGEGGALEGPVAHFLMIYPIKITKNIKNIQKNPYFGILHRRIPSNIKFEDFWIFMDFAQNLAIFEGKICRKSPKNNFFQNFFKAIYGKSAQNDFKKMNKFPSFQPYNAYYKPLEAYKRVTAQHCSTSGFS